MVIRNTRPTIQIGALELFTLGDVCETFGVSMRTLQENIKGGGLRANRIGRDWYVSGTALREYFEHGVEAVA